MRRNSLRSGAAAAAVLGSSALGLAADVEAGRQTSPAPDPATTGQPSPDTARERIPDLLIRGQLNLTPQQRQQIWQSVERTNVEEQPIPRAFAPAVGQTAPPELKLTPLPPDLQQMIPGLGTQHQFARLERGTILIIGEGEARLVVAMIRSDDVGAVAPPSTPPTTTVPAR
jgi:hypothetical protein